MFVPSPKNDQPCFKKLSFAELKGITKNFSMDLVLDEGGFGMVFKATINEVTYSPSKAGTGMVVAVKRFNTDCLKGLRGGQDLKICDKYVTAFADDADAALSWATRLKIATGAAQGLAFLHVTAKQVMYFDLKASNVLLDKA
ncbi:hypothetical protein RJ639_035354 [Escallonia herrerae]|uniref:Protein kinase domain-containing protein n=1 Tax=Escallonia herrerae TaxID=1293975 RepID=A0AA88WP35_9ASTE|nr:hypothetical protein RJ639_035354 [Escallonia herrerae]